MFIPSDSIRQIIKILYNMKKSYIYPRTEVSSLSGSMIMLGASGDVHSGTEESSQTENFTPGRKGTRVF